MATTGNGIYYPSDYSAVADILSDLKKMAESIDESVENKVDKVDGKGLSTNDYTDAEKEKINLLMSEVITNKYNIEELQDDNAQNKSDISNIQAEQIEQNAKISELEAEKKELQEDVDALTITGQASGESIDLNDSSSARFKSIELTGNSKQETREGYNFFNKDEVTRIATSGGDINYSNDKLITPALNTYNWIKMLINSSLKAGTYYLTFKVKLNSGNCQSFNTISLNNDVSGVTQTSLSLISNSISNSYQTIKAKLETTANIEIQNIFIQLAAASNAVLEISEIMIASQEDAEYEEYGAMPSLDFPSEIKSVGEKDLKFEQGTINSSYGNNTTSTTRLRTVDYVEIQSNVEKMINAEGMDNVSVFEYDNSKNFIKTSGWQDIPYTFTTSENTKFYKLIFRKSDDIEVTADMLSNIVVTPYEINEVVCNKNLLNCKNLSNIAVNTGIEIDEDGYVSSGIQDTRKWDYENSNWFLTLPKGTYIISLIYETTPTNSATGLVVFKSDNTRLFDANYLPSFLSKIPIFTLEEKSKIGILLKMFDIKYKIQIEKATTATDYAEHEEQNISIPTQQPFRAIGDVRDCFVVKENGKRYERHWIARIVLDGTQNISQSASYSDDEYFCGYLSGSITNLDEAMQITTDSFNTIGIYTEIFDKECIAKRKQLHMRILANRLSENSSSGLTSYLASNPITVDYVQVTPTDIECTAEQNEALDKLENARTYKNVTHIYSNDEVSPLMDVTYAKDLETVLANVQALANTQNETQNESEVEV